jgi:hypothetical protein
MIVRDIAGLIQGNIVCCAESESTEIEFAFASDLMSDVLTIEKDKLVLITGLSNLQVIRTSEMSDISCVIFARAKKVNNEIIALATEMNIALIESPYSVFRISGLLYEAGLKPVF